MMMMLLVFVECKNGCFIVCLAELCCCYGVSEVLVVLVWVGVLYVIVLNFEWLVMDVSFVVLGLIELGIIIVLCNEVVYGKLVFDFYLCVVVLLGVVFEDCVVVEDSVLGVVVGLVVGMLMIVWLELYCDDIVFLVGV